MSLRSLTENEIALTLALSHRNGRGNFSINEFCSYPCPLWRERERWGPGAHEACPEHGRRGHE